MKEIVIFTDGSCKGAQGNKRAGCGVYFQDNEKYNISCKIKKRKYYKSSRRTKSLCKRY